LISGWKAIIACGLYLLVMDHDAMMQMPFEELIMHISKAPTHLFD